MTRRVAARGDRRSPASRAPSSTRSGSPTSARRSSPGTRRPASRSTGRWSGRTGAPQSAATSCAPPGTSRWCASAPGSSSTPTSPATKIEWLLRNVEGAERAVVRHGRLLAALQADRPPRDRPHQRLADDAVRHPSPRLGRGALRAARRRPGATAGAAALGPRLRHDLRVRRRGAGGGDRRRPAGGPLRPGLPPARDGEEHLRHRQLRPPQHGPRAPRPRSTACSPPSPAASTDGGRRRPTRWRLRSSSPGPRCSGCATGSG